MSQKRHLQPIDQPPIRSFARSLPNGIELVANRAKDRGLGQTLATDLYNRYLSDMTIFQLILQDER